MKLLRNTLILWLITFSVAACTTVKPGGDGKSTSPNTNQSAANSNASQTPAANKIQPSSPSPQGTGSIEVTSIPPGARVLLVLNDEGGGANEPQPRGITPTTITGVYAGKYTVDLEKPGYRFFQKDVVVKPNTTAKVNAALRKQ